MAFFFRLLIRLYQLTLSPILASLGSSCRFHPSCSEYSSIAFNKYPWHKALFMSLKRIVKCQPLHPGGIDYP